MKMFDYNRKKRGEIREISLYSLAVCVCVCVCDCIISTLMAQVKMMLITLDEGRDGWNKKRITLVSIP